MSSFGTWLRLRCLTPRTAASGVDTALTIALRYAVDRTLTMALRTVNRTLTLTLHMIYIEGRLRSILENSAVECVW
jgi:hypothetical protein